MKIIKLFTFYIVLVGLTACDNPLNLQPKTNISESNFYKTESQLINAENEIYRQLGKIYDASSLVDLAAESRSDNTLHRNVASGVHPDNIDLQRFRMETENTEVKNAWDDAYKAIFICNNIINRLKKTKVTFSNPELKKRLLAEATSVRSLIFFNMLRAWGSIPLPLKPLSVEKSYQSLREDRDVVYKQIINDLKMSKKNLPESYSGNNKGRITKYGAAAILAKIYLRRGNTQKAKNQLKEIIESNLYSLDANKDGVVNKNDYLYIFKAETKNSKSSIAEVQYKSGTNAVNSHLQIESTPWRLNFHLPGQNVTFRGLGQRTPTPDLINEFERADSIRKSVSVRLGYKALDTGIFIDYPYTMKFYDPNYNNEGQNFEIIRYADILLLYSEVTNDPSYLNKVRARVGLPGYGEPEYPNEYNTLEAAIEHERRMELCFEDHRFFDLVRTGRAVEVMQSKGYNINENKLVFPIPQHVIDVNPAIKQNAGY